MKIEKGTHGNWREFGFRIRKAGYLDYDEVFVEFNLWKYFVTIVFD